MNMATAYLTRESLSLQPTHDPYFRHIPVKRVAPCPPSDHIIAQAKRSRMVYTPVSVSRKSALTIRNSNQNIENENSARAIAWDVGNCHQSYHKAGFQMATPATPIVKGLNYDPINSNNLARMPMSRTITVANDARKSRCCPLLMSSTGYSTPPYGKGASDQISKESKRPRRRPLAQRLKRRSAEGKKVKVSGDVGCFDAVKNAAHGTIKTAQVCLQNNATQSGPNALSVYNSFLKQREDAMRNERSSELPTNSTALGSCTTNSIKTADSSIRYSSNFNPQLTSTPQRPKLSTAGIRSRSSLEFKVPQTPPLSRKTDHGDNSLAEVLKALEEERRLGSSHIMLPLTELTDMVREMQQRQQTDDDKDTSTSSRSTGTTVSNNNNDDLSAKIKPFLSKPTLPGMYPIGAPRAASSPIAVPRKRENAISEDFAAGRVEFNSRKRHPAGNNESVFSVGLTAGATDVWRPW